MNGDFKQTDLGVLPAHWDVEALIDCCDYADYRGKTPLKSSSGTFLITARNVRKGFIDYEISKEYVPTEQYDAIMRRGRPKIGDVLITTEAPLGNVAQIDREDVALAQRIIKYRPKTKKLSPSYLKFYLLSDRFQDMLNSRSSGSTAKGIKGRVLHKLPVVIPPSDEQRPIVAALSNVDALISALDKHLAKKHAIKSTIMQQLLAGTIRLEGFQCSTRKTKIGALPETWDTPRLAELFSFKNGLNKSKAFFGHGTPIVNYMDVYERRGLRKEDLQGLVCVNKSELQNFEVRRGDVFFTRTSETAAEVGISSVMLDEIQDTVFSGFILRARPKDSSLDNQFKQYCFSTSFVRNQITSQTSETTRALTNGRALGNVVIARPPLPEQRAIANVLDHMDAEIRALERRRDKTKSIKQGMMQQLLTGKVRLI